MKQGWFERLTEVMAAMAAGDTVALGALYEEFGDPIRAAVRKELARLGVAHVDAAEVDGLALDVCTDLYRRAKSWDPARGVAPWTWAALRVRSIVGGYVGQFADPLPEGGPPDTGPEPEPAVLPPAGRDDENVLVTLGRLAEVRSELRLLEEALGRVSRPGQQEILLEAGGVARSKTRETPTSGGSGTAAKWTICAITQRSPKSPLRDARAGHWGSVQSGLSIGFVG